MIKIGFEIKSLKVKILRFLKTSKVINNKAMRIFVVIVKVINIFKDLFCEEPAFDIHHKKKPHFAFFVSEKWKSLKKRREVC